MSILRCETRITGPSSGGEMVSVQHYVGDETQDPATLVAQAAEARDRITAFWNVLYNNLLTGALIYPAERVVVVDFVPPQDVAMSAQPPIVCSGDGEPLPWHTQGIITLRDGSASRGGYGRIFIPYLLEGVSVSGRPNQAIVDVMNNAADQLALPQGVVGLTLGLYHRATGVASFVATAQARNYWAYLSSRRD